MCQVPRCSGKPTANVCSLHLKLALEKEEDLIWVRVIKTKRCWYWRRRNDIQRAGRPMVRFRGKTYRVARLLWELTKGPIPKGMQVLHRCDNEACIRPSHTYLGGYLDNARDAGERGQRARGSRHGGSRLTEKKVVLIRKLYAKGYTQKELARAAGVGVGAIRRIVQGRGWTHLPAQPRLWEQRLLDWAVYKYPHGFSARTAGSALGVNSRALNNYLHSLKEKGLIERTDSRKHPPYSYKATPYRENTYVP